MFKWLWRKLSQFWSSIPPQKEALAPFPVVLVKRAAGPNSKRGIHAEREQIEGVVHVYPSLVSPYTTFDFMDGTRLSIHHDRLLEWSSQRPQVK